MSRFKVALVVTSAALSRRLESAFVELLVPPAQAVALFRANGGWRLDAYYAEEPDTRSIALQLQDLLDTELANFIVERVPDENWVAVSQSARPPVRAGRFAVHGSHDRANVARGPNTIEIDAGEAFGTAHHATTFGCLLAIESLARKRPFRRMLDFGCGSGVLAISMARAWPQARIDAIDIDPDAVRIAAANARLNGVSGRMTFRAADGTRLVPGGAGPGYDLVTANILAGPLVRLAPKLARAVAPGGALVLSGLLEHQSPGVSAAYLAHGFFLLHHRREAGWSTLTLRKRDHRPAPVNGGPNTSPLPAF